MKTIVQNRIPEVPFRVNHSGPKSEPVARSFRVRAAWYVLLAAAIGFIAAGSYTVVRGWDARNQVRAQLVAEHITTTPDSAIPNKAIQDAATAKAQADVIKKHTLEATGGKTYAQLERTNPVRATAFQGDMLRTSLLSAVLAFNVANFAMGFGAFVAAMGLLIGLVLILLRPKFKTT